MCDSNSKEQKWKCDYCTYENFPSSIKCTMCKGAKPLLNEDIYRLSPPQIMTEGDEERGAVADVGSSSSNACGTNSRLDVGMIGTTSASTKWACKICTYLNWPRSLRCVQCCMKRGTTIADAIAIQTNNQSREENASDFPSENEEISNEDCSLKMGQINKELQDMRICSGVDLEMNAMNVMATTNNNDLNEQSKLQDRNCSTPISGAAANRLSPFDQKQHQQLSSQENSSTTQIKNTNKTQSIFLQNSTNIMRQQCGHYMPKWICHACTYENWPKSLKCSMCGEYKEHNLANVSTVENIMTPSSLTGINNVGANGGGMNNKIVNEKDDQHETTVSANNSFNKKHLYQLGSSDTINNCDTVQDRMERRQRQIKRQVDWQWLNACLGVVENNHSAVEAYLSCGGNPARSLTSTEITALNRNSAFDVGHTLIHLAIRFHREEMLPMLFEQISGSGPGIKRVPSYVAPDLASDIRRYFANTLRIRKSVFNCHFVQEHATFMLPAEIEELPMPIQDQLFDELLDRDAQKQLENPPPALNWSLEITARLGSRLLVLWNRSAGDCLLDSAMQATWGVFDRDNILRRALADSLHQCGHIFYSRWKEYEMFQASILHFTLEEAQWEEDWSNLLSLASQPGSSLEQLHIFALSHILRRPIIVYGVKYVKSFRGEDIGYARFEGLYLPLFWDQNFCIKSPISLGYTRGHFSALVPMEPFGSRIETRRNETEDVTYLPLMDCESKLLPIHFLTAAEMGREEAIMRQWLDVCVTEGGLLVAQQKIRKRPLLVAQMLEEWLNHYRRIAQIMTAPYVRRPQQAGYSSDGDSDEE